MTLKELSKLGDPPSLAPIQPVASILISLVWLTLNFGSFHHWSTCSTIWSVSASSGVFTGKAIPRARARSRCKWLQESSATLQRVGTATHSRMSTEVSISMRGGGILSGSKDLNIAVRPHHAPSQGTIQRVDHGNALKHANLGDIPRSRCAGANSG